MTRVACSPITWGATGYELILDDVAGSGYAGVEASMGALEAFGRQPGRLRALLDERTLTLTAAPFAGWYFERDEEKDELERLRRVADFLGEVTPGGIIVFRTVPHPARRDMVAGQPPLLPLDDNRMGRLAESLNRYSDMVAGYGLKGAIANRLGTFVETPDEVEAVLERTEPGLVWLAPDLGHLAYAGGDAAALVRAHPDRLLYPRLKDFDQAVFDKIQEDRLGVASFTHAGGFKVLGTGSLDLVKALMPLVDRDFDGWVCVELEVSTVGARQSATISRDFLREHLHW